MPPSARKSPSKTPTAGGTEAARRRAAPGRCPARSGPEELAPAPSSEAECGPAPPRPQVAPPPRSAERAVSVGRGVRGHVTAAIRARADARRHASSLPLRLPGSHGHPPAAAAAPAPSSTMAGTLRAAHAPPAQPRRLPQLGPGSSRREDRRKVATGGRRAWRFLLQRPPRHPGARRWVPGKVWPAGPLLVRPSRRLRAGDSGGAAARQGRRRPGPAPGPPARALAVTPSLFLGLRGRLSGGRSRAAGGRRPTCWLSGPPGRAAPGRRSLVLRVEADGGGCYSEP